MIHLNWDVSKNDAVDGFYQVVALDTTESFTTDGDWTKLYLDSFRNQIVGNSSTGAQLGKKLANFSSPCR